MSAPNTVTDEMVERALAAYWASHRSLVLTTFRDDMRAALEAVLVPVVLSEPQRPMTDLGRIDLTDEEREFVWTAMEVWNGDCDSELAQARRGGRWFDDDDLRMSVQRKMFGRQRFDEEADDFVDMFWNPREKSHHRGGAT